MSYEEIEKKTKEEIENPELTFKREFERDKKKGVHIIAEYLVKKHCFLTISGEKNDEFYYYKNGIYLLKAKKLIETEVENILGELISTHYLNEIVAKVKRMTLKDREDFEVKDLNLICLNNGILDIKKLKLIPHSPKYLFTSKIPVDFDPEADCPEIKKFLSEILHKEDIKVIQEWFGYCLYRRYFLKKAMILVGEKNSAKTTILNLLVDFIGQENKAGVPLQHFTARFTSSSLYGKLINVYDELTSKDLVDVSAFKIAVGNGQMSGEYKFGDRFEFVNFAKLIFACNAVPAITEDDDAFYDRWIVVRCDNKFEGKNRDTDIGFKISTKKELSGLLNIALRGLKRIIKHSKFSYRLDFGDVKKIMERSSSSISAFCQDELIQQSENWISKSDLFLAYEGYCNEKSIKKISVLKFSRVLTNYAFYITDGKKGKNRGWRGVALKKNIPGTIPDNELIFPE